MGVSLDQLNAAAREEFVALLDGTYEHSPWIAERAHAARPFRTLAALKAALAQVVHEATVDEQLGLIRAHPELAGKAMVAKSLTAESTNEQSKAGLTACTPEEFERLQQLNRDYNARFGWPFILAVRGPRGTGLTREQIIGTFARRLEGAAEFERAECLRNIHRIAEIRLNDKFGISPSLGDQVWDWAEQLAVHSDPGFKEQGQLTVTYLTEAHRACAAQLRQWMLEDCGFDEVSIDAVGNVVGVYHGEDRTAPRLLTGSHYDTVRNGGKYDGRLGILVPMACVRELHRTGRRLPYGFEVVGFAEEEGQRYKATFLGSSALTGHFDADWLTQRDAEGITMREAMVAAGLPATLEAIEPLRREPARYRGFVELHIEQGPVLDARDLPLGIVTSINGSVRYLGEVRGTAAHAGTTPMGSRRDAAAAVAELVLAVERLAGERQQVVGTVGIVEVPAGSINVIPGRCRFSLDLRATSDAARDELDAAVRAELAAICSRRGLSSQLDRTMIAAAAPSDPALQARWEAAVQAQGLPLFRLPSGAGHDAMKLHELMPQAMLFVRGGNEGISHNPLESITADDAQLCVETFLHLLEQA
ncbi:2-oxo-4-hydroxy-4-carboxy-5-ureidoimidazoline decarboxylase [Pelomonas sp. SE-A7]|uniref:2-oxo-4-hydroxy-4-carboxy-5-ureidoimidazoline decarboxylase n=1 Tax=Pelomonas sp. SE-A7 TaxID=3054953 RepID=UPI00259C8C44|nr:2-oxo-4-hydroxy-4-carboxy-5-ureidoimidazoline decarboxylase [Pelomonas sp. SE-A7]MDM4766207.1 2-oxo-4-hydroxy-4-carboxy-5-ureidoimidazoline decarboxylase [Pelomonas sp. SE-A7]